MLQKAGERAGPQCDGALLIAGAQAVEQELRERSDVFAALAQRRNRETNRGQTEGKVRQKKSLASHLAQRGLRRSKQDGAARGAILQGLQNAEEQSLAGRGEQIDAVEIGKAGERGGVGIGGQPLAGVAALEVRGGQRGERLNK